MEGDGRDADTGTAQRESESPIATDGTAPSTPTDAGELTVTLCTACGRWVAMPALTPEVSDETAWALQTEQHWPECPWVLTRGYHIATERAGGERGC